MQTDYHAYLVQIRELFSKLHDNYMLLTGLGSLCLLLITLLIISKKKNTILRTTVNESEKALLAAGKENDLLQKKITENRIREAKLATLIRTERQSGKEKLALLEEAREQLRLSFTSLAQEIFEDKSKTFNNQSKERIESLLQPFHNQLGELKEEIRQTYLNDTRERTSLKKELDHLKDLNRQINQEAVNLTRALKGDKKMQGNWGEMILEKVLEQSGLKNGREYQTQRGLRDDENRLYKPDVIINLPDDKHIIVDSKVSLVAWEKFCSLEDADEKQQALKELARAIRAHISTLSDKNYEELEGIRSLDFVLMFMPIDAVFLAAFDFDEALFSDAFSKKVIIVTPTTLLATLRTIENIWRYEHQSRNSLEIAKRAGALYDKFRGFTEDLEKIGKQLDSCNSAYDSAVSKLSQGRGNLVSQAQQLIDLGVQVKKELPKEIVERSGTERTEK